jgi:hypothetical protein
MDNVMNAVGEPVSFGALVVVLLVVAGAVWGFQAAFKSGKRETALDEKLAAIANDAALPSGLRSLAAKAQGLELTAAAQAVKSAVDPAVAELRAKVAELEAKIKG